MRNAMRIMRNLMRNIMRNLMRNEGRLAYEGRLAHEGRLTQRRGRSEGGRLRPSFPSSDDDDDDPKSFFNFAETWYADSLCRLNIFVFPDCRRTNFLWVFEGRLARDFSWISWKF